ncbi:MAG: hypothetical protein EXS67_06125 [Candidatus Margulisbacteria bacterium]|nr:hypothetical protein [Candidatus Margulisiibacteriota bacterium]
MKKYKLMVLLSVLILTIGSVAICAEESDQKGLSQSDVQELSGLSKSFKNYLTKVETANKLTDLKVTKLQDDQVALDEDMSVVQSELEEKIEQLKKENDEKSFWMIIGIVGAATLGLIAH